MRELSRDEVRESLRDLPQGQRKIHLPADFDALDWPKLEYLGWKDPRSPLRSYLVVEVAGKLEGIGLERVAPPNGTYARAVMCNLCRSSRRFHEVSMFVSRDPSASKREQLNGVGTMLCTELDCAAQIQIVPPQGPLDPPADSVISSRREGLRARVTSFVRSARRAP